MERKKLSGKEVRYILLQNRVNLSWLSKQLGMMSTHSCTGSNGNRMPVI